jgi:hypothetical protein
LYICPTSIQAVNYFQNTDVPADPRILA